MYMSYEEASNDQTLRITRRKVEIELDKHTVLGVEFAASGDLVDCEDGEMILPVGKDGLYSAAALLCWLGY